MDGEVFLQKFQFTRPRGARPAHSAPFAYSLCFNSRAHAGRDSPSPAAAGRGRCFNSRAHAGRDRWISFCAAGAVFQFTRPRGARQQRRQDMATYTVSIHAPTRGATPCRRRWPGESRFNSRAHAGRDGFGPATEEAIWVSIHAPTRGATTPRNQNQQTETVSIHAPTRGATPRPSSSPLRRSFNSRAHAGRDTPLIYHPIANCRFNSRAHAGRDARRHRFLRVFLVSIHAPTRGATGADRAENRHV